MAHIATVKNTRKAAIFRASRAIIGIDGFECRAESSPRCHRKRGKSGALPLIQPKYIVENEIDLLPKHYAEKNQANDFCNAILLQVLMPIFQCDFHVMLLICSIRLWGILGRLKA